MAKLRWSEEYQKAKEAEKMATAWTLWVLAINYCRQYGWWAFVEVIDRWNAENTIRAFLAGEVVDGVGPLLRKGGKQKGD